MDGTTTTRQTNISHARIAKKPRTDVKASNAESSVNTPGSLRSGEKTNGLREASRRSQVAEADQNKPRNSKETSPTAASEHSQSWVVEKIVSRNLEEPITRTGILRNIQDRIMDRETVKLPLENGTDVKTLYDESEVLHWAAQKGHEAGGTAAVREWGRGCSEN
jgi:hypothetical protein